MLEEIPRLSEIPQFGEGIPLLEQSCWDFGVLGILLHDVVESHNSGVVLSLGIERFPHKILGVPCLG